MSPAEVVPQSVSRRHTARILQALGANGVMSRNEIAKSVGITRTTLSELITTLLRQGVVVVAETDSGRRSGRGRPAELLALDPASGQFMGIDFGRGRVHVAVADASHKVMASGGVPYDAGTAWTQRTALALELIESLSAQTGTHYGALRGIGIGFPGPLSPQSPQFPSKRPGPGAADGRSIAADISDAFEEQFTAPVIIDNNTRFAALAEASWGRPTYTENLLYLRLAGGVGGGIVAAGRLIAGASGFAAELGHVSVDGGGRICNCGKKGCLETLASLPSILERCRAAGADVHGGDDLRDLVNRADPIVAEVLRESASAVGRVIGAAAVTLNPAEIVLAGEVIDIAPTVLNQATNIIKHELLPMLETVPNIRGSRLGDDAGALGALVAVFHHSPLLADYPDAIPES